jgi:hypothetical protein
MVSTHYTHHQASSNCCFREINNHHNSLQAKEARMIKTRKSVIITLFSPNIKLTSISRKRSPNMNLPHNQQPA